jgi:hypothetical protein
LSAALSVQPAGQVPDRIIVNMPAGTPPLLPTVFQVFAGLQKLKLPDPAVIVKIAPARHVGGRVAPKFTITSGTNFVKEFVATQT